MALHKPFDADSMPGVMMAVMQGERQAVPSAAGYSSELIELLDGMLELRQGRRLTVAQVQAHPVVKHALHQWELVKEDLMATESRRAPRLSFARTHSRRAHPKQLPCAAASVRSSPRRLSARCRAPAARTPSPKPSHAARCVWPRPGSRT